MSDRVFDWMEKHFAKLFVGLTAVVVGLIFTAVGCIGCHVAADLSGHTKEVAQQEADAFIRRNGMKATTNCADTDSDGDGYVSCPLVLDGGRIEPLECAGSLSWNSWCRPPKAVVRAQ